MCFEVDMWLIEFSCVIEILRLRIFLDEYYLDSSLFYFGVFVEIKKRLLNWVEGDWLDWENSILRLKVEII